MRLGGLEYEGLRGCWVQRCIGDHLKGDPVQIGFSFAFQREVVPQVLGANHVLQHSAVVLTEAKDNK
jgi:hypothetical protein